MLITIITYGLISFLSWLAIYVHSKLLNRETKKSTYLKIILLCNVLVLIGIKISQFTNGKVLGNSSVKINELIGEPTKYVHEIGQNIISSPANF